MMHTCFRHPLSLLCTSLEDFLGRNEEDAVTGLRPVHHAQLLHQEVGAPVHVLAPHLQSQSLVVTSYCQRPAVGPSTLTDLLHVLGL